MTFTIRDNNILFIHFCMFYCYRFLSFCLFFFLEEKLVEWTNRSKQKKNGWNNCMYPRRSIYLSIYRYLFIYLNIDLFVCLSIWSFYLSIFLSVCLSVCLLGGPVCQSAFLFVCVCREKNQFSVLSWTSHWDLYFTSWGNMTKFSSFFRISNLAEHHCVSLTGIAACRSAGKDIFCT